MFTVAVTIAMTTKKHYYKLVILVNNLKVVFFVGIFIPRIGTYIEWSFYNSNPKNLFLQY
jgi:hypothetical protein